jgi:hypothetical protein
MTLDWLYENPSCSTCDSKDNCFTRTTRNYPPDYGCYTPSEQAKAWKAKKLQEQVDELGAQLAANHARLTGSKP